MHKQLYWKSVLKTPDTFGAVFENYPDSPLSASVIIAKGNAYEGLGEIKKAARAYLNSFSLYEDPA